MKLAAASKLFAISHWPLAKFLFSFLLLVTCYLLLVKTVYAGACDPTTDPANPEPAQQAMDTFNKCAIEKNVFDDKIFNTNQIAGTVDSLNTLMFGTSQLHPETNVATRGSGALAATGNLVATLYRTPPASGVEYVAQSLQKFNPVQPAYAQAGGIGYSALQPVQRIWTVFRNISYVGFVIVFVIMGFMIMFRTHISPQAVATVQDSIPRIVIALVLVTFSYAIAGLMIDIMFLVLNIVIKALPADLVGSIGNDVFQKSVFGIIFGSWTGVFSTVANALKNVIGDVINLPGPISWLGDLISFLGGGIAALVVGIAILFIMFRVFFMLLMAYVMVIVLTMVAPFFFLFQALPGRNGAGEWFKQMASQISVFPTVALMFVFAGVLGGLGGHPSAITQGQIGQFPLLAGDINLPDMGKLIGVGLLLMTPSAAELVRNALGVRGQGGAAGAFAPGAAALGAAGGFLGRRASESSVGQAAGALSKQGGQGRAEWVMRHAPSVLKPKGVRAPTFVEKIIS